MSTTSILSVIQHYQRSIEKCQTDEARLLHCISKLYNLPVQVEHLQETGIGKTVNSLRKFDGEIGTAAKTLVAKWKSMVAAAEQPVETPSTHQDEDNNNRSDEDGEDDDDDDEGLQRSGNVEINGYEQHNQSALEPAKTHNTSGATSRERERDHSKQKHEKERSSKHGSSSESRHKSSSSAAAAGGDASSKLKSKSSHSSSSADRKHNEKHHKDREEKGKSEHRHEQKSKDRDGSERRREEKHKSSSSSHKISSGSSSKTANISIEEHTKKEKPINADADKRSSSSSTKDKDGKSQKHEHKHDKHNSSSSSKDRSDRERNEHKKHSSKSSTKTKDSTEAAAASSAERKRRHNSDQDSNDSKSPTAKVIKHTNSSSGNSKPTDEKPDEDDEGIDSSMGANFSDVLGMLNMPSKKSKKTANAIKTAIAVGPGYTPGASAATSSSASSSHAKGSSSSSGAKESKSSSSTKQNGVRTSFSAAANNNYSSTRRDVKPDLLSSSAKLEPLDPSIALDLPAISTNYKPMPLNQTVMDCVYAQSSSYTNPPKPVRSLTDAEAYSHGISSKTMRTKIYSGVRTGQILQVPSLFDLCIRVLQKNIDALEYTGGVPFDVLRPVLERASPHQLLVFEEYNPYLMEDSDVLWQHHVQRHYRAQKRQEMESWREMFLRCQDAQERKLNILAESIKQSQKIIAAPVRKTQLAFVDSMVKPPRNVQRKQEQFGTKSKMIATPAARVAALSSVTPNAAKTGDARLRVAASVRDHAQVSNVARSKKAPLMAKTLQFMRRKR